MTTQQFVLEIKVKLNRIDTSSYADIRPEEVVFFANQAIKQLVLGFDLGYYSQLVDPTTIKTYLAQLYKKNRVLDLTDQSVALPEDILKIKGSSCYVVTPATDEFEAEKGWVDTRFLDNDNMPDRMDNPFLKSYPDKPIYRLVDDTISFEVDGFDVTKIRLDYLEVPEEIVETGDVEYPFNTELEDKTVTLILENLEARRLQTQPMVSKT